MNIIIIYILIAVIWFVFLWAAGAFVSLEPNVLEWSEAGRFVIVFFWFIPVAYTIIV